MRGPSGAKKAKLKAKASGKGKVTGNAKAKPKEKAKAGVEVAPLVQSPTIATPAGPKPKSRYRPVREVSVQAWVEDAYGYTLFVKQRAGNRLWTFPGGKVRPRENLMVALARELKEEIGLAIESAAPVDLYDRPERQALTVLYRVLLKKRPFNPREKEIDKIAFRKTLPRNCTPSAKFFWDRAQRSFEPLAML